MERVKPSLIHYGLGEGVGSFSVVPGESVDLKLWCEECGEERVICIDPRTAPILRLIAYRLDEIARQKQEA